MSLGIYSAMNGAAARSRQLENASNNLANINTPGYRESRIRFESFMESGRTQYAGHVKAVDAGVSSRPGRLVETGQPLHVLPQGKAFLSIESENGEIAYTRDGRISINPEGLLEVGGRPLLDDGMGYIFVPLDSAPIIDGDGNVLVDGGPVGKIGRYELNGNLSKGPTGLIITNRPDDAKPSDEPLLTGYLEQGKALDAGISLITAQRFFDMAMKAIETYQALDRTAVRAGKT